MRSNDGNAWIARSPLILFPGLRYLVCPCHHPTSSAREEGVGGRWATEHTLSTACRTDWLAGWLELSSSRH